MKSETEAKVWWVAAAMANAIAAVGTGHGTHPLPETSNHAEKAEDEHVVKTWECIETEVVEPAMKLVTRHCKPAGKRGQRRASEYSLGISTDNDADELALFRLLGFLEVSGALIAAGATGAFALYKAMGPATREWLARLRRVLELSGEVQLPLDTLRLQQLARAVELLSEFESAVITTRAASLFAGVQAVQLLDDGCSEGDGGKHYAFGRLFNPNLFDVAVPAVCVDYGNQFGARAGHVVVWPNGLRLAPGKTIEFIRRIPEMKGMAPLTKLRIARSPRDFCDAALGEARFPGSAPINALVADIRSVFWH